MTKKQYNQKVNELITRTAKEMREKAKALLATNAIELSAWDKDYRLPKAVLHALCRHMAAQWRPFTDEDKKESNNILIFC